MPTVTEQTLTVHNLYAMRDNIGLSRSECKQPPRHRSLFEWGKEQQAYYLNNLTRGITSPPKVFIYEPFTDSSKAAVLDGRQRLKAIFSYLDGNYPLGETAPDGWAGKTYKQLQTTAPNLADALMRTPCGTSVINAASYWEAAITAYPQICGHTRETVKLEQELLMLSLDVGSIIFMDKEFCDARLASLQKSPESRFRYWRAGMRSLITFPDFECTKSPENQIRATEFVARHHHRGVIPC